MFKAFSIVDKGEIVPKALELARKFPVSLWGSLLNRKIFEDVETLFIFIGYPRSGHSLIGSLLDAHPNIIVAHELNVLKYLLFGFGERQIYHLILENSRTFTDAGRTWCGYSYRVPFQWQGRFKALQILGDKKGYGSTLMLRLYPELLERLRRTFKVNLRFIHVIRNPYDSISTTSKRRSMDLLQGIQFYFSACETVADIRKKLRNSELFELRHEVFIDDTRRILAEICHFLGADASSSFLNDCASIVIKSPKKTRYSVHWTCKLIDMVKERMAEFPFLEGYSYNE